MRCRIPARWANEQDARHHHIDLAEIRFPFFLVREADALAQIAALLPPATVLITGGIRPPEASSNAGATRAYNSIYVVDHVGSIISVYDKVHLVPFGEYLPFRPWLERIGLLQLTKVRGGFIPATVGAINAFRTRPISCRWYAMRSSSPVTRCLAASGRVGCTTHRPVRGLAVRRRQRRAARLAPQSHQRWLVWRQQRTIPALPAGRVRAIGDVLRWCGSQYRNFGRCRSVPANCPFAPLGGRGRLRWLGPITTCRRMATLTLRTMFTH